jgi:hypothetical protein
MLVVQQQYLQQARPCPASAGSVAVWDYSTVAR